jgi:hypothetical protein
MNRGISDVFMSGLLGGLSSGQSPARGNRDDDDDRDDEHTGENEASVREVDENTEAPEEFSGDDEDDLPTPEETALREDE